MFKHITEEANKLRVLENNILSDYKNGINIYDMKEKYNCTLKFIERTIECYGNREEL